MKKRAARPKLELVYPTAERMKKAETYIMRGDTGLITMRDSPLERLEARQAISAGQYTAACKLRHHWHHSGMEARYASLNMDGVFGGGGSDGLPSSEAAMHHRDRYREAVCELGIRMSMVAEDICCREVELTTVGRKLGWNNDNQARAVTIEVLKEALDRLCRLWGVS